MLFEKAFAKINLFLDVISRHKNGFHDIKSVMHSLDLADELTFSFEESETVEVDLEIIGQDELPRGDKNLVSKAARRYLEQIGQTAKVHIVLNKNIPAKAGLGGGSSDAAATLRAMNRHFDERLSVDELISLAIRLGSDVPYCLFGGPALTEGRGEIVTPLATLSPASIVVAIGEATVSTPRAYALLDEHYNNFDGTAEHNSDELFENFLAGLLEGKIPEPALYNIFEQAIAPTVPEVMTLKDRLSELGASSTMMSGSGPAVFAIFGTYSEAEAAAATLNSEGFFAVSAQTVD